MRVPWTPRDGAYVMATLTGPGGSITLPGLVDTGAEDVLLDQARLHLLGLVPTGRTTVLSAGGQHNERIYQVNVTMAGRALGSLSVVALEPSATASLLLGRGALRFFRLMFDGPGQSLEIL